MKGRNDGSKPIPKKQKEEPKRDAKVVSLADAQKQQAAKREADKVEAKAAADKSDKTKNDRHHDRSGKGYVAWSKCGLNLWSFRIFHGDNFRLFSKVCVFRVRYQGI